MSAGDFLRDALSRPTVMDYIAGAFTKRPTDGDSTDSGSTSGDGAAAAPAPSAELLSAVSAAALDSEAAAGIAGAAIFVPLISQTSLAPLAALSAGGPSDRTLLEYRLALSLQSAGRLQAIFPIRLGPPEHFGSLGAGFGDFEAAGGAPSCPEEVIEAVERLLTVQMLVAGIPKDDEWEAVPASVQGALSSVMGHEGFAVRGPRKDGIEHAADELLLNGIGILQFDPHYVAHEAKSRRKLRQSHEESRHSGAQRGGYENFVPRHKRLEGMPTPARDEAAPADLAAPRNHGSSKTAPSRAPARARTRTAVNVPNARQVVTMSKGLDSMPKVVSRAHLQHKVRKADTAAPKGSSKWRRSLDAALTAVDAARVEAEAKEQVALLMQKVEEAKARADAAQNATEHASAAAVAAAAYAAAEEAMDAEEEAEERHSSLRSSGAASGISIIPPSMPPPRHSRSSRLSRTVLSSRRSPPLTRATPRPGPPACHGVSGASPKKVRELSRRYERRDPVHV